MSRHKLGQDELAALSGPGDRGIEVGAGVDWYRILVPRADEVREPRAVRDGEPRWRASELGYCLRRQWLRARGVPETVLIDERTAGVFQAGTVLHEWLRRRLDEEGLLIAAEVPVRRGTAHGHVDLIVRGPGDVPVGVEVKTMNTNSWAKRSRDRVPVLDAHHALQVGAYQWLCETLPDDLRPRRWVLLILDKDSYRPLEIPVDHRWASMAAARISMLDQYWEAGVPPDCTCGASWEARYCPYRAQGGCCPVPG